MKAIIRWAIDDEPSAPARIDVELHPQECRTVIELTALVVHALQAQGIQCELAISKEVR